MVKIPLVRPSLPDPEKFIHLWRRATEQTGQFSNFGPLWKAAADRLSELTGRDAIPVSSGTEAVALATLATQVENNDVGGYVAVEAFTFEATRIAAERLTAFAAESLATNQQPTWQELGDLRNRGTAIRTVPFGCHRSFVGRLFDGAPTVIDAAGGFGPSAFNTTVRANQAIAISFHATKNFPIGEGGAVLLPLDWQRGHQEVMRAMNFGFDHLRNRVDPSHYATNAKLDELRAAMLCAQLMPERIEFFRQRSARIRRHTLRLIERVETLRAPYQLGGWQSLVVVQCTGQSARNVSLRLADLGIGSREVYANGPRPDLLLEEERDLLALPSDCTDDELELLAEALGRVTQ